MVVFLLVMLNVSAQDKKEYQYYDYQGIGVKAGATYYSIALTPAIGDIISGASWSAGLVYTFTNTKYVGIQLEALLSNRKWKESIDEYSAETELQFAEVPLMTNINLGSGRLKYIINLGTYLAFKVDKKLTMNLPEDHEYYQSILDRNERGSDFGLLIGGAIRYISDIGIFQLDARYAYGYQKMYNEEASGFRFSNMSGLNVGLIYMLNLKKK